MAAWGIGRLAYFRRRIPARIRGRTLAFMGGVMRVTRIITPVIGGFLVKFQGFRMIFSYRPVLLWRPYSHPC